MASFASGANAFLNSPYKEKLLCPNPATERGTGLHLNCHPSLPLIIYPSGKYIVVRNVEDPGASFIYRGHGAATSVAKFSPNGYWVASADTAGKVRVWSWDNPEHMTKLESQVFAGGITDLDWDMESKKIVLGGDGSGILVKCITWDTGNSAGEMVGHNKRVLSVAYKPSRPFRVISASEDMKTIFFAGPPFKLDHSMNSHTNFVNCVRYSTDGARIVSVGSDKKIQMYDGKTGEMTGEVPNAHAGGVYSVSFNPEGTHFMTASADKTVKVWNAETLALENTLAIAADPQVGDAQVSCLWTRFAMLSVSLNGNINVLSRSSPAAPERIIQSQQVAITAMDVDAVSQQVYTGSSDGVMCVRDVSTESSSADAVRLKGADKRHVSGGSHGGKVVGVCCANGGVVSVGWDDKMRFASAESKEYHTELALDGQPCSLSSCTRSTDLLLLVTTNEVSLYRGSAKVASTPVASLGFTPTCGALLNEEEIALGGADFKTHIFAIAAWLAGSSPTCGPELAAVETRSAVSALSYSPVGDALAIGDAGRQVEVYERGSWSARIKGKWVFHTSKITCLAWNQDGSLLASGSIDENIYIWNCAKPSAKLQLPFSHTGGVTGVQWLGAASTGGEAGRIVSTGNDHTVVTWKLPPAIE